MSYKHETIEVQNEGDIVRIADNYNRINLENKI
jgi:hypothetical protein